MAKIDNINDRILRELSRDGRLPNLELAERVGLSPSACLRRVQELERAGVIKGYRAVLDPAKLGVGFVAYLIASFAVAAVLWFLVEQTFLRLRDRLLSPSK